MSKILSAQSLEAEMENVQHDQLIVSINMFKTATHTHRHTHTHIKTHMTGVFATADVANTQDRRRPPAQ